MTAARINLVLGALVVVVWTAAIVVFWWTIC